MVVSTPLFQSACEKCAMLACVIVYNLRHIFRQTNGELAKNVAGDIRNRYHHGEGEECSFSNLTYIYCVICGITNLFRLGLTVSHHSFLVIDESVGWSPPTIDPLNIRMITNIAGISNKNAIIL